MFQPRLVTRLRPHTQILCIHHGPWLQQQRLRKEYPSCGSFSLSLFLSYSFFFFSLFFYFLLARRSLHHSLSLPFFLLGWPLVWMELCSEIFSSLPHTLTLCKSQMCNIGGLLLNVFHHGVQLMQLSCFLASYAHCSSLS